MSKTRLFALILYIFISFALVACSNNSVPSKSINNNPTSNAFSDKNGGVGDLVIVENLQDNHDFYPEEEVTIKNLEIIKRQTNIENKNDLIFVRVIAENDIFRCTSYYDLVYILYNEGWLLDEVKENHESEWVVTPRMALDRSLIDEVVATEYSEYQFKSEEINLEKSSCTYEYDVTLSEEYGYKKGVYTIYTRFNFNNTFDAKFKWAITDKEFEIKEQQFNVDGTWIADSTTETITSSTNYEHEHIPIELHIKNINENSIEVLANYRQNADTLSTLYYETVDIQQFEPIKVNFKHFNNDIELSIDSRGVKVKMIYPNNSYDEEIFIIKQ